MDENYNKIKAKVALYLRTQSKSLMKFIFKLVSFFLILYVQHPFLQAQNKSSDLYKKLEVLDSLSQENFISDSLLIETITLAKQLKEYDIAVDKIASLIKSYNYNTNQKSEAKKLISQATSFLHLVEDKNIISRYYFEVADLYYYSGAFEASLKHYDSAFYYAKNINSSLQGLSKFGKGIVYVDTGDFGKASIALQEAITYFKKDKDTLNWINAKNSITILYGKNGFYEEEEEERNELINLTNSYKNYPNLPSVYYNAAASANKTSNQKKRISYLLKALLVNENSEYKDFFQPILNSGLAAAYADSDSIAKAEKIIKQIELDSNSVTGFNESFYLDAKMRLTFAKKKYRESEKYGLAYLKLKRQSSEYEEIQQAEQFLSKIYKALGDEKSALKHYESFTKLKDSISNVQKLRVLSYYQTLYETEKRDLKIQAQQGDIELLNAKNKLKAQWLWFGSFSLIIFFIVIIILRSRSFMKKQQKLQESFTQQVIASQEHERNKLAMELHDSVGQQLMLLVRKTKVLPDSSFQELASEALSSVRTISHDLYPVVLMRLGFSEAVQQLVNSIDENSDMFFTTEIMFVDDMLNDDEALHLYRIIQEVLQNTLKHSESKSVLVEVVRINKKVILKIKDNGAGFNVDMALKTNNSLGLKSIKERCKIIQAELFVESHPNKGTLTKVIL